MKSQQIERPNEEVCLDAWKVFQHFGPVLPNGNGWGSGLATVERFSEPEEVTDFIYDVVSILADREIKGYNLIYVKFLLD